LLESSQNRQITFRKFKVQRGIHWNSSIVKKIIVVHK